MKTYGASTARERLSEVLDEAERGEKVFIERKGVRYRLTVDAPKVSGRAARRAPLFDVRDANALEHGWTWDMTARGARFRRRSRS